MKYRVVIDSYYDEKIPSNASHNELVSQISNYMYDNFREKNIVVKLIQEKNVVLSTDDRTKKIVNAFGNDAYVIVISNGMSNGEKNGTNLIYALRNNDYLPKIISKELFCSGRSNINYFQKRSSTDSKKDYHLLHRDTGITRSIIINYGYIDNKIDLINIKLNYKEYVDAIIEGVLKFIDRNTKIKKVHIVKSGDSLYSIASRYGVMVHDLKNYNNLDNRILNVGQIIYIVDKEDRQSLN